MSVWIERSDPSLQSVLRDAEQATVMQNVQVCLEPPDDGGNAIFVDSLEYDPESRRLRIDQFSLSIKTGGLDDSVHELLEFASFFKSDFKAGRPGHPLRKRLIEEIEPRCVKPVCEIHDFSIQTSSLIFSAKRFDVQDGDFLYFKTAFFKEIAGRGVSITPIPPGDIKQVEAAALLWRYPIQQPILAKGAVRYSDRRVAEFDECVFDLSSMEIQTIMPPARINAHPTLSILPGMNTRLWIRNKR